MVHRGRAYFLVGAVSLITGLSARADTAPAGEVRPPLAGEVRYSETEAKSKDPRVIGFDKAMAWAESLSKIVSADEKGAPSALEGVGVTYLSVLYLHCATQKGSCPFILDAILEADVIASRDGEAARCTTMKSFWKSWLGMQLEDRAKFLVSVAAGLEMATFNSNERPRYVDCKPTVAAILEDHEALAKRYGAGTPASAAVDKLVALLTEVKTERIDVFGATGVKLAQEAKP